LRYAVKKYNKKFQRNLFRVAEKKLYEVNKEGGTKELDKTHCRRVANKIVIEKPIEEFHKVMELACSESFSTQ
jgi:hypothetical protein